MRRPSSHQSAAAARALGRLQDDCSLDLKAVLTDVGVGPSARAAGVVDTLLSLLTPTVAHLDGCGSAVLLTGEARQRLLDGLLKRWLRGEVW